MKYYRSIILLIPLGIAATLLWGSIQVIQAKSIKYPSDPTSPYQVTLYNLHKYESGVSSHYAITNTGSYDGLMVQEFLSDSGNYYDFQDSLGGLEGRIYDLGNISEVPDGFKGNLTVFSDVPITGSVLPGPVPPCIVSEPLRH